MGLDTFGRRTALATITLVASITSFGHAQPGHGGAGSHRDARCRAAAEAFDRGAAGAEQQRARAVIASCPAEGPAFLTEQWKRVGSDTASVDWLRFHSTRIRDARLFAQLRQTVLDRSRPDVVRVGAMLVLMKYSDPHGAYWFSDVRPPSDSIRRIPLVGGSTTAGEQLIGAQPIAGSVTPAVLELLEHIASRRFEESRTVWYAAAVLTKRIKFDLERGTLR